LKSIEQYIHAQLKHRQSENNFRSLKIVNGLADFYSNDYLGFARDKDLKATVDKEVKAFADYSLGSTGARLLSGNSEYAEALEKYLAGFHEAESALLFNSGFDANYGLLAALPYRGDTIIYDELVHASMHDGIRASKAASVSFEHNHVAQLEEKLSAANGLKYVVVESVYSMDGDFAPLVEIADLCNQYDAGLIVDEAHATGIFGPNGAGRVAQLNLQNNCLARIYTFGKAIGAHGAAIAGSAALKDFLINYCRPFIFSTALPIHSLVTIQCAYRALPASDNRRRHISELVNIFRQSIQPRPGFKLVPSQSPIQSILVEGNAHVKELAASLQAKGFDVRAILYPTVARGKERIRICLHYFNTAVEVRNLAATINTL
jgi:8-amino-7-oxononanoate synthase